MVEWYPSMTRRPPTAITRKSYYGTRENVLLGWFFVVLSLMLLLLLQWRVVELGTVGGRHSPLTVPNWFLPRHQPYSPRQRVIQRRRLPERRATIKILPHVIITIKIYCHHVADWYSNSLVKTSSCVDVAVDVADAETERIVSY